MTSDDVIHGQFPDVQAEIRRRLQEIMDANAAKDIDLLESYHLYGPKFSKFSDSACFERLDTETTKLVEREFLMCAKSLDFRAIDPKVDVFGVVAIVTFVLNWSVITNDDEECSARSRATIVFVKDGGEWKIVHEHFSPFHHDASEQIADYRPQRCYAAPFARLISCGLKTRRSTAWRDP